jgi:hypothetical protein
MVGPEKERPERLAVVHVCEKCDSASTPPGVNEDVNVTGVVHIQKAKEFYGTTLGLELARGREGTLIVPLSGGTAAPAVQERLCPPTRRA